MPLVNRNLLFSGAVAACTLLPAMAQAYPYGGYRGYGYGFGGFGLGVAAGALAGGLYGGYGGYYGYRPYYYGPPVVYAPPPVIYAPPVAYQVPAPPPLSRPVVRHARIVHHTAPTVCVPPVLNGPLPAARAPLPAAPAPAESP